MRCMFCRRQTEHPVYTEINSEYAPQSKEQFLYLTFFSKMNHSGATEDRATIESPCIYTAREAIKC